MFANWASRTAAAAVVASAISQAVGAATVVVMTDPMSLERKTYILDTPGPDRLLVCAAPPAVSGCRSYPLRR